MRRLKNSKKKPTRVTLDETTILDLKTIAELQGTPYQFLIRVFILDGLERLKKAYCETEFRLVLFQDQRSNGCS